MTLSLSKIFSSFLYWYWNAARTFLPFDSNFLFLGQVVQNPGKQNWVFLINLKILAYFLYFRVTIVATPKSNCKLSSPFE